MSTEMAVRGRLAVGELRRMSLQGPVALETVTIQVYVHIITRADGTTPVTNELIAEQMNVLNQAYANRGFAFTLAATDVLAGYDSIEEGSATESNIKSTMRVGGASTLNLYFGALGDRLLGWATFPWYYSQNPYDDGVMIADGSMPGGSFNGYNYGYTAVHEVGHWLGLYHPWGLTKNGCKGSGDAVRDTPAQKQADYKCNGKLDTCASAGRDPIRNFMGYTPDSCMTNFSRGQATRMLNAWYAYRSE